MPAKSSGGRGAAPASGAESALRSPSNAQDAGAGHGDSARGAADLDKRLAELTSLEDRLLEITRAIPGRVTFSTSLGLEDQAVLHAIATSAAQIDVFTLDTGRHFPETLETLAGSEQRYGIRIHVVAPDAR